MAQVVLKNCYNMNEIKDHVESKITEFAGRGYRALGLAMAEGDDKSGEATSGTWGAMRARVDQRRSLMRAFAAAVVLFQLHLHAHEGALTRESSAALKRILQMCRG